MSDRLSALPLVGVGFVIASVLGVLCAGVGLFVINGVSIEFAGITSACRVRTGPDRFRGSWPWSSA